ncbi:hypothetical protein EHQ47_16695 [Leptospira bourretii]|uniref:hypothetical protein n=1 Tax=Leptospira bourretii TaxID=2484962 RepID=UPI0010918622|nr:hypothetical protein [Leptospira bourretii]TGL19734.1 hypothetical protein EHQ47_16695 [Leptospira bourretii]
MKKYYSSRNKSSTLTEEDLYQKVKSLYSLFLEKDYFKNLAKITKKGIPQDIILEADLKLSFQPFPIEKWENEKITETNLFDLIEYLYDYISKPIGWNTHFDPESDEIYEDYNSYDPEKAKREYCELVNMFLNDYGSGYELSDKGEILSLGSPVLEGLFKAEIIPFDKENVDKKIENAILKWRRRNQSLEDRKNIILELSEVFEWLKKTSKLELALENKDDSMLFNIINNFAIRHHNPNQKSNYDKSIWYSWMFHFYLATYHATIRLIIKQDQQQK